MVNGFRQFADPAAPPASEKQLAIDGFAFVEAAAMRVSRSMPLRRLPSSREAGIGWAKTATWPTPAATAGAGTRRSRSDRRALRANPTSRTIRAETKCVERRHRALVRADRRWSSSLPRRARGDLQGVSAVSRAAGAGGAFWMTCAARRPIALRTPSPHGGGHSPDHAGERASALACA